jgi:CO/xanthine dehydrogenase FAD-binding subunit
MHASKCFARGYKEAQTTTLITRGRRRRTHFLLHDRSNHATQHVFHSQAMNLHTVTSVERPASAHEIGHWQAGDAWLAGGTWLFSEPQPHLRRLIDLQQLGWAALTATDAGLDIAATCRIAELHAFRGGEAWTAAPLIAACCESLLASFKIWNAATVGGNICMSLPAGALICMAVALEGELTLLARDGTARKVAAIDFVIGNNRNVLLPGELLRNIHLPAAALSKRYAIRRASLTQLGRSAALLAGTRAATGELLITITASTPRPVQLRLPAGTSAQGLADLLESVLPEGSYFDDVNGTPAYKRHVTRHFAEQIRAELQAAPGAANGAKA